MGRPTELTEEERQRLIAEGYRPVEVWVLDQDTPEFQKELERMCRKIRESDRRSDMPKVLDAFLEDIWDELDR